MSTKLQALCKEPLQYSGINKIGLRRRGFDGNARKLIKEAYKLYFRSELNRKDAHDRLFVVIRKAAFVPKKRIATKPSFSAKKRRLDSKTKRGAIKKQRRGKIDMD